LAPVPVRNAVVPAAVAVAARAPVRADRADPQGFVDSIPTTRAFGPALLFGADAFFDATS
jgi:hypothetical protein